MRNNSHIHPISSNLMELQAIRSLSAYADLIASGVRDNTTPGQAKRGTISFLTPKGFFAIHKNGTIRRSWAYSFLSIDVDQSPVVRNLPLKTAEDYTNALLRISKNLAFSGKSATIAQPLDTMELLMDYARKGKNINSARDRALKSYDYKTELSTHAEYKASFNKYAALMDDLIKARKLDPRLADYFERERILHESYRASFAQAR